MKKIFALLLCWLMVGGKAVAFDDIPDAKQFGFNQQYVIEVFMEHIAPEYPLENTSDQKQQKKNLEAALKKYNALSANGENKISAVDFLDVCAAGGLKVKQSVGYSDCLSIFSELIDLQNMDDGGFNMFCPATYDENGKQLNRLKSLDENTMVGDDCSSTNIAYGVVTIRKPGASGQNRYACTCLAMSCGVHPKASQGWHYVLEGGQCKESAVGADGFCVRQEFDLSPTNGPNQYIDKTQFYKRGSALYAQYVEQGEEKCDAYAVKGKCKYKRLVMNISTDGKKVSLVCNPTEEEAVSVHENIKQSREQAEAKIREDKLKNLKYRAVCAQKSRAKNEICVGDVFTRKFFGGIQVDVGSAKILVKEWARNNGYREIECSNEEPRTIRVVAGAKDYGIQCVSLDVDKDGNRAYYEFLFDDVVESWDNVIRRNIETAIVEKVYKQKLVQHTSGWTDTILVEPNGEQVCKNMTDTFSKIYKDEYTYYYGKYSPSLAFYPSDLEPYCRIRKPEHKRELNTAFGINPLMFCKNEHQQLRNDGNIEKALQEYISTVSGVSVANIDCTGAVQYKKYCGWDRKWGDCKCKYASFPQSDPGDDIKTCTVYDGETTHKIDFVFDDFSEWSTKLSETSFDAVQCVIAGEKINITRQMLGKQAKLIDTHNEGTKCAGLTKDMCEGPGSLDEVLRKNGHSGAYYDESKRACILVSAEEYRTQELAKDIGIGTVVTIGVAVAAYFSGGSVLIIGGVFGGVDLATNVGFYLVEEQKEYRPARKFEGFVKNAKLCKDSDCAFKTIQKYYSDLNANASQFNEDDLQYMGAELERLFGMIETDACYVDQNGNVLHQPENMNDCSRKVLLQLKSTDMGWEVAGLSIIAGSFFDPESGILKVFSKSGRIARMLKGGSRLYNSKDVYKMWQEKKISGVIDKNLLSDKDMADFMALVEKDGFFVQDFSKTQIKITRNLAKDQNYLKMHDASLGIVISNSVYDWDTAYSLRESLRNNHDAYAVAMPTIGVGGNKERYRIVAIPKEEALAANLVFKGEDLVIPIDNSRFLENYNIFLGKEITKIGETPVILERAGVNGDRAIVMVRVGDKEIPFYVSSGLAGKTKIPTGKWEPFGGLYVRPDTGRLWFGKGNIEAIQGKYGSPELEQIAMALDNKLGDPRDTELFLSTIARKEGGGVGVVAECKNLPFSEFGPNEVNVSFKSQAGKDRNQFVNDNINDIIEHLKQTKNKTYKSHTYNFAGAASSTPNKPLHKDLETLRKSRQDKSLYKELVTKYHPDKVQNYKNPELVKLSEEIFKEISNVYTMPEGKLQAMSKEEWQVLSEKMTTFENMLAKITGKVPNNVSATENVVDAGKKLGRWNFKAVTDNKTGITYYEYEVDDSFGIGIDKANQMAGNLLSDFGEQSVIFERGDKYVIAIFDNVNDLNVFKGGLK